MIFRISLMTMILASGVTYQATSQVVSSYGQLQVKGTQLVDKNGDPVVLRGMSLGWHNWWPRFYNDSLVHWLQKDWRVSMVRAAMGVEPRGGYIENPDWSLQKIETIIQAAIAADIYVIIDWHCHNIHLEEAKEFFRIVATKYGTYPHVIYEIFNEPDDETWEEVKAYSEEIIKTIREIDPYNVILVGSPHWDQDVHLAADNPIKDVHNVMYTLHFYAASHKAKLRERGEYALSKGLPLFVSESAGMMADGNGQIDHEEWERWINWMESHKISWITWAVSDKGETCSALHPTASSTGGWSNDHITYSGLKIRALLQKYSSL